MKCRDCTNLHLIKECKNLLWCDEVLDAPYPDTERECQYFKRATNADRIRAMSDEELATLCEDGCPPHHHCPDWCGETGIKELCQRCWLDWLKSTSEE